MNQKDIKKLVDSAINQLIEKQLALLQSDVSERALTYHLANYIAQGLPANTDLSVDVEYNRRGISDPKRLMLSRRKAKDDEIKATTVFPDIIIHHRGDDVNNLLVLEIKKIGYLDDELKYDARKLTAFRSELNYKHTAHVIFGLDSLKQPSREVRWIPEKPITTNSNNTK